MGCFIQALKIRNLASYSYTRRSNPIPPRTAHGANLVVLRQIQLIFFAHRNFGPKLPVFSDEEAELGA